jgi:hypothetical protein
MAHDSLSLHHLVWERRQYTTPIEKTYRSLGALMVPLHTQVHRDLHHHIPPPPKPSRDAMLAVLVHVEDWASSKQQGSPSSVAKISDFYSTLAERSDPPERGNNLAIATHLMAQLQFVEKGYYYNQGYSN